MESKLMMAAPGFAALVIAALVQVAYGGPMPAYVYPEHVHLSYADVTPHMYVTWTTFWKTNSMVQYGPSSLTRAAHGNMTVFYDKQDTNRTWYIHRVLITDVEPATKYYYRCGSSLGWSDLFFFTSHHADSDVHWTPWFGVYGDMGSENAQSVARLQTDVITGRIDIILHVGDFAYDLNRDEGRVGDAFMQQIEPIAAYVPYMTTVGNHENEYNFTHYKNRFTMPGNTQNMFYSFNAGHTHFISMNTEAYYYLQYGKDQIVTQLNWLKKDLEYANKPEVRKRYPWIVVLGHRPMYCAIVDSDDCNNRDDRVRVALETLFYEAGVDIEIWAHEHEYQRMYPLYNFTVCNGSSADPYRNPRAPVHIISGSAGCRELHDTFKVKPEWVASNVHDYGYTRMRAVNQTHFYVEQISDDKRGKVVDQFHIIKDKHYAGLFDCHKVNKNI